MVIHRCYAVVALWAAAGAVLMATAATSAEGVARRRLAWPQWQQPPVDRDFDDEALQRPGYPALVTMREALEAWPVEQLDAPLPPVAAQQHDSLRRLDYTVPEERAEALALREAELPFIVYNVPDLNTAVERWTDEWLVDAEAGAQRRTVRSDDFRFLYFSPKSEATMADADKPTITIMQDMATFLPHARAGDAEGTKLQSSDTHYYLTVSWMGRAAPADGPNKREREESARWVPDTLKMFDPDVDLEQPSLFLREREGWAGIHCRFGERGVTTQMHFDHGRNFLAMARGKKRYILAPPDQCRRLHIMSGGPSGRQSALDLAHPEVPQRFFEDRDVGRMSPHYLETRVVDTLLDAGDVLYVPALWFHAPVNLESTIQCNARSGTPPLFLDEMSQCSLRATADDFEGAAEAWTPARRAAVTDALEAGKWPLADHPDALPPGVWEEAQRMPDMEGPRTVTPKWERGSVPSNGEKLLEKLLGDPWWVPTRVRFAAPDFADAAVDFCLASNEKRLASETGRAVSAEVLKASGCSEGGDPSKMLRNVPWSVVEQVADHARAKAAQLRGIVFHQSRCGSTLVAQMLATDPLTLVWNEPIVLGDFMRAPASDSVRSSKLAVLLALLGRPDGFSHLVIKPMAEMTFRIHDLLRALPDPATPWAFVFRDPAEIVVSNLITRNGPDWWKPPCLRTRESTPTCMQMAHRSAGGDEVSASMQDEQACTTHIAGLAVCALEALGDESPSAQSALLIAYEQLPEAVTGKLLDHFDMGDVMERTGAEARMTAAAGRYSKRTSPDKREFGGDAELKQTAVTPAIRVAVDKVAQSHYERMLDLAGVDRNAGSRDAAASSPSDSGVAGDVDGTASSSGPGVASAGDASTRRGPTVAETGALRGADAVSRPLSVASMRADDTPPRAAPSAPGDTGGSAQRGPRGRSQHTPDSKGSLFSAPWVVMAVVGGLISAGMLLRSAALWRRSGQRRRAAPLQ